MSSTSELQHGPVLPHFRHHVPACLQDKVAVDELLDAGDGEGEGEFRVHNAEGKVQMDAHSLEPRAATVWRQLCPSDRHRLIQKELSSPAWC